MWKVKKCEPVPLEYELSVGHLYLSISEGVDYVQYCRSEVNRRNMELRKEEWPREVVHRLRQMANALEAHINGQ